MQVHESGIKIFEEDEYVHPDDMNDNFLEIYQLKEGDVFLMLGTPYRVEDDLGIGDLSANKIKSPGLSEWVLSGNFHSRVKWHGTCATYEDGNRSNANPVLVPYKGKTYICHNHTGEIIDSVEGECLEQQGSDSIFSGISTGSWSDIYK